MKLHLMGFTYSEICLDKVPGLNFIPHTLFQLIDSVRKIEDTKIMLENEKKKKLPFDIWGEGQKRPQNSLVLSTILLLFLIVLSFLDFSPLFFFLRNLGGCPTDNFRGRYVLSIPPIHHL